MDHKYLLSARRYTVLTLSLLVISVVQVSGQNLQGKIVDSETGEAVPGILVIHNADTTVSDPNGRFSLGLAGEGEITFRGVGYELLSVPMDANVAVVNLKPRIYAMEGITVNGFVAGRDLWKMPMPISRISRRELDDIPPTIVTPALNLQPGIFMQSGTINTNRISIRGIGSRSPFSTNKLRAYFGDIPLTNGSGETTIEDIDLSWIGRFEIIKGPSSTLHGAGLGGAMLLYPDRRVEPTGLEVDFTAGSFGLLRTAVKGTYSHDNGSYKVFYSNLHSDGYRENNEVDREAMGTIFSNYGEKSENHLLAYYLDQRAYIPSSLNEETFLNDPSAAAPNWLAAEGLETYKRALLGYSHRRELSRNWRASAAFFGSFFLNDERRPFNILDENVVGMGLRPKVEWDAGENIQVVAGLEYFMDWYSWATYVNDFSMFQGPASRRGDIIQQNRERRRYTNVFAEMTWQIDRWTVTAGGNLNTTSYRLINLQSQDSIDNTGNHFYDPLFTPKVGFSYAGGTNWIVFGSISQGFSPPALEETLNPDGSLNTDIKPERGFSYELGTRWSHRVWTAELNLYHMDVRDLLIAQRTAEDAFVGVNAGRTSHSGLESVVAGELPINDFLSLRTRVSYAWNRFRFNEFVDEGEDFSGNELTGYPSYNFSAQLGLGFFDRGEVLFTQQSVGAMPITDANDVYTDPYHLLNARVSWQQSVFGGVLAKVAFGVDNVFDAHYASMVQINASSFGGRAPRYYYPGLPRNYYVQIKLNYGR